MIFFGHIGITFFLATLLSISIIFAILGAVLPDLCDKILFMLKLFPCGRFFGHSVFFAPLVGLVTYAATRRKDFAMAITFGAYMHLLEDTYDFLPLFVPFVNYNLSCKPVLTRVIRPIDVAFEILGVVLIIIAIKYRSQLMKIGKKIKSKLKKVFIGKRWLL